MKDHPSPHTSHARRGALKGGRSSTSPTLGAGPCTGAVALLAAVLFLSACAAGPTDDRGPGTGTGTDAGSGTPGSGAAAGIEQTQNDLRIVVELGDGAPPQSWTLVCAGVAEGTHPDPQAACTHLAGMTEPFAPLPDDVMCTEQYGGPQTARITGRWHGAAVDLELSRVDGCRIAQWDALGPVLLVPVGLGEPLG